MSPGLPSRIGRYEVLDRLGEGGMGVLYLARDPALERTVAIKVLSIHSTELIERFAREARSAARLKHQHIVTIYDVGEDDGRPFIAMEYIDGETLAELIRRRPPLGFAPKLQIIIEMCTGLAHAHHMGIIHRDIKPANVMITSERVVKILDFGLARLATDATQAELTRAGVVLGTPHYMSPEQVDGLPADERSDIFAVGLVLYELLAYRKAFAGDTPHAVLHKIATTEPQPLRELCAGLDPDLERIVQKATAKLPEQRYQKLQLMVGELERLRARLRESANEPTVRLEAIRPDGAVPASGSRPPSGAPPRHGPDLAAIARRRSVQIDQHLAQARQHIQAAEFEAAIEQCELAAVLDPRDSRVIELFNAANRGVDDRQVRAWLDEAQAQLSRGAFSDAEALIAQSLQLRPESEDALHLRRAIGERRREQERARERARVVRTAIERARSGLGDGAFEAAARAASEALAYDPANQEARALKEQAAAALEERQRQQQHEQRALDAVAQARQQAADGEPQIALVFLQSFTPSHAIVDEAAAEIAEEIATLERRRRDEEQLRLRRLREEEERRQEAARAARELEDARRRQAEEERQRREDAERRAQDRMAVAKKKTVARAAIAGGQFAEALTALTEARTLWPSDPEIEGLVAGAEKARTEAESARRREERKRAAEAAATEARRVFAAGNHETAIRLLEGFSPPSLVAAVLGELKTEFRSIQRRLREEEARKTRDLEESTEPFDQPEAVASLAFEEPARSVEITPTGPGRRRGFAVMAAVAVVSIVAVLILGRALWRTPTPTVEPTVQKVEPTLRPKPVALASHAVSINAVPWATVRIAPFAPSAEVIERTTPFAVALPEGEYRLEFLNPAFQKVTKQLVVGSGGAAAMTVLMPGADVDRIVSEVLGVQ